MAWLLPLIMLFLSSLHQSFFFLSHLSLRCPTRLCSWPNSFHTLHNSTEPSYLITFYWSSPYIYADDTQLFLSFSPTAFQHSINHLQSVLLEVSNWMSANLLTLNPAKTEFLLIGLPQQLAKIPHPSLSPSPETASTFCFWMQSWLHFWHSSRLFSTNICPV